MGQQKEQREWFSSNKQISFVGTGFMHDVTGSYTVQSLSRGRHRRVCFCIFRTLPLATVTSLCGILFEIPHGERGAHEVVPSYN